MPQIRFNDISALREEISEEFGPWGAELTISQELIDEFADLTGDNQWIHVDAERAKDGPFGTTIAHGLLTLAILPRIRTPASFEAVGQASTVNYGSDGLRFLVPVRSGDVIHARSRVIDVQAHARGTRLTLEIHVHVVGNERPSLVFKTIMLYTPPPASAL